jgi:hypothetical protein
MKTYQVRVAATLKLPIWEVLDSNLDCNIVYPD